VAWASAAALAVNQSWYAVAPVVIAMLVLTGTWNIRPR